MYFTDEELKIIYLIFNICIKSVEHKKGHKTKNDIIALKQMNDIKEKIDFHNEENEKLKKKGKRKNEN